jgi:uncharacterized repeat protein (TIGR01451 family)
LLNSVSDGVGYAFSPGEVIAIVQDAYASGDFSGAKNQLASANEEGCPLGRADLQTRLTEEVNRDLVACETVGRGDDDPTSHFGDRSGSSGDDDDGSSDDGSRSDDGGGGDCAASYKITVRNVGAGHATDVVVQDVLPDDVTFVSAVPVQGSYDPETGIWDAGDLASGAMAMMLIEVDLDGGGGDARSALSTWYRGDGDDDDASGDHDSGSRDDDASGDHDSGSHDDDSSGDRGESGLCIENCATLVAVDQTDINPENDRDCVTVFTGGDDDDSSSGGGGPICPAFDDDSSSSDDDHCLDLPDWWSRYTGRTTRLLDKAAHAESAGQSRRLARRAGRMVRRLSRKVARAERKGIIESPCAAKVWDSVAAMKQEARQMGARAR